MENNLEEIVWPEFKKICPSARLGGIFANKRGYHNKRRNLPKTDYSVQLPADKRGPDDQPAAIDLTFPDAQRGDYSTIKVYSKRLYVAGVNQDPRTEGWREFFGNTDNDTEVEGWDFAKNRPSSSDDSHLWHIHLSEDREGVQRSAPAYAILSVLKGETLSAYELRAKREVKMLDIDGKLPELRHGDEDPVKGVKTAYVRRAQAVLSWLVGYDGKIDGDYGDVTAAAVKEMMAEDPSRSSRDGRVIGLPEWRRITGIW